MSSAGAPALEAGSGELCLVWFPALGDRAASFGRTLRLVARRFAGDARLVAFDPPGYASPSVDPPPFSELYPWAVRAVQAVSERSERVVLMGNSSGAALAIAAAAELRPAAGVVMVCWPDWRFGTPPSGDVLCPRDPAGLEHLLRASWHAPPQLAPAVADQWLRRLGREAYRRHADSFDSRLVTSMLDRLRVPLGVVAGASDRLVPLEVLVHSATAHGAQLEIIPRAGHYPHLEAPQALADVLCRLVKRMLNDAPLPRYRAMDLLGCRGGE